MYEDKTNLWISFDYFFGSAMSAEKYNGILF